MYRSDFEKLFKGGIKGKFTGSKPYFCAHYDDDKGTVKLYDNPPEKLLEDDLCAWGMMLNPKTSKLYILYQRVRKYAMGQFILDRGAQMHLGANDWKRCFFLSKETLTTIYETFPESETLFEGFSATIAPEKNSLLTKFIASDMEDVFLNTCESMSFKEFAYRNRKPASFMMLEEYFNVFYIGDTWGDAILDTPDDIEDYIYVPYVDENVVVSYDI